MKITYCKGWSIRRRFANQIFSNEKAEKLFNQKKPFGLVIEKEGAPYCFIDFNNKFIYVGFLDGLKREYLGYEFSEIEKGKLFLKEVQFWEYEGEENEKVRSTRYRFTPEGKFGLEKDNYKTNNIEKFTAQNKIDVTTLYEEYPRFNNYDAIIKLERDIPITLDELS